MSISFKEKIKTLTQILIEPGVLRFLFSIRNSGYLIDIGWFETLKSKSSVDKYLSPIPWVTYSFIDFIDERLNKTITVFEYGSGFSTLYYARKTKKVVSVEHNAEWFDKMQKLVPQNVEMIYCAEDTIGTYSKVIHGRAEQYDLIIVDANDRANCIKESISKLTSKGVLVLDDSERIEYREIFKFLNEYDFKHISFWGISPGCFIRKATTIFYRNTNCLGI